MIGLQTLSLFCIAVLGLLVSPGPNMAFVLSTGVSHGVRGGVAAAAGIFAADLVLTALTAAGVAAAAIAWPPSFDILRYSGAAYLLWLALDTLRSAGLSRGVQVQRTSTHQVFRRALLTSLLNPKALLFFLVFLPQFVDPARGRVALQLLVLGLVLGIIALVFHTLLGVSSGRLGVLASGRGATGRVFRWLRAGVFLALAIRLVALDSRALAGASEEDGLGGAGHDWVSAGVLGLAAGDRKLPPRESRRPPS